ncbi:MAG: DUF6062 family protein, partial [Anaerolineae bacterium]
MNRHTPYFECVETLEAGACPMCELAVKAVARHLDAILYECITDPTTRDKTRRAQGFCRTHAWQLRRQGGALGIAIAYRDVIDDAITALEAGRYSPPSRLSPRNLVERMDRFRPGAGSAATVRALQARAPCPVCATQRQAETMYADVLLENLEDERMRAAFDRNGSLCLPHLRLTLERVRSEAAFRVVTAAVAESLRRLRTDLDEMIRRHDYRFTHEGLADVGDAWIRAIARVAAAADL